MYNVRTRGREERKLEGMCFSLSRLSRSELKNIRLKNTGTRDRKIVARRRLQNVRCTAKRAFFYFSTTIL